MKIGILTFHDGINFGAFLQAYSLQQKIQSLGHEVKIINYKKISFALKEYVHFLKADWKLIRNYRKIRKFKKIHENFNLTSFCTDLSKIGAKFDVFVFGSDEVWNINNPGFGFDPSYFGKGLSNCKLVSYAPSFGSTKPDDKKLHEIEKLLCKFDNISVRDYNSQSIVKQIVGSNPLLVPDPTFLMDQEQWLIAPNQKGYILVYATLLSKQNIEQIKIYADKTGKKLVAIGIYYDWCDENYIDIDPFEWIGYFKNASYVFTSMFHGTIYSILMRRQFTIFMDPYRIQKFSFLLKSLELENRISSNNKPFPENEVIDYSSKEKIIESFSKRGHDYLESAL